MGPLHRYIFDDVNHKPYRGAELDRHGGWHGGGDGDPKHPRNLYTWSNPLKFFQIAYMVKDAVTPLAFVLVLVKVVIKRWPHRFHRHHQLNRWKSKIFDDCYGRMGETCKR
jgi:hypothetical protein